MDRTLVRRAAHRAARYALDVLLPPLCPGCDVPLGSFRWLCTRCRRRLRPAPPRTFCLRCRVEDRARQGRRAGFRCRRRDHRVRAQAAFWLEDPLDRLIHDLKYGGATRLARPLARWTAEHVEPPGGMLVPVPLHRVRRRERGFNQAELLAGKLADYWGEPVVPDLLRRVRATRAQARRPRAERAANLQGAFRVGRPSWADGRRWVVVDDVLTTGATSEEASRVLLAAGAASVAVVAVALA